MLEGESATLALRLRHLPPDAAYPEEATLRLVRIREETDLVAEHFPPPSSRRLLERPALRARLVVDAYVWCLKSEVD